MIIPPRLISSAKRMLEPLLSRSRRIEAVGALFRPRLVPRLATESLILIRLKRRQMVDMSWRRLLSPCEGVVLSFKGNKGADLGVDYTKGHFVGTAALDVKDLSKITASSCYGLDSGFNIGGDATYALSGKTGISEFNLGASYTKGPTFASITTAAKVSQFNLGMVYKVNSDLSLASQTTHSSEKPFDLLAVGGIYKAPFADIKAKVSGDGVISACVMKEIVPKVTVTATGSVTATDMSTFKYGLGVSM